MTYRIYVRWPDQRVSDKTSTESRPVADFALEELRQRADALRAEGALGVACSLDGKQLEYLELNADETAPRRPTRAPR
jgi:hypothetical protein